MSKQSSPSQATTPKDTQAATRRPSDVVPAKAGTFAAEGSFSAQRLFELYNRVADSPDAIERLRKFVLDLAIRGKLVEQDQADEPAEQLLERIAAEKERLYKIGEIRKPKKLPALEKDPYPLPTNWCWTRVRQITSDRGQRVPDRRFTYIDVSAIDKEAGVVCEPKILSPDEAPSRARKITSKGDVIYSCVRPYLLNIAVIDHEFIPDPIVSTAFAVLNGHDLVLPWYLWVVLRSPFMIEAVEGKQRGQAYPAINDKDFSQLPFPLAPLEEQHRIVAKVNDLMALLDRLETTRTQRETTRNRLTTASLTRLTAPEATEADFPTHARFALENLDQLTSRAEQIKILRQTILSLAVRGKLVRQDSTDETATIMLERLKKQRVRLQKDNRIPCQKSPAPDPARYIQELPENWACISLGEVINFVTSGSRGWAKYYSDTGAKFIRAQNIRFGYIALDNLANVQPPPDSEGSRTQVFRGDLLVVITGAGVTNPAKLQSDIGEAYVSQHIGLVRPTDSELSDWLLLCLMADCGGRRELEDCAYGAGRPGLNLDNIRSLTIPLPPLAEQRRIVAKVGALMSLCDRLEAAAGNAETIRARLFHTFLHEALRDGSSTQEAA